MVLQWDDFYGRYSDWSQSTLRTRISALEDIGSADEVIEVIESFWDEKLANQLARKALRLGLRFNEAEIEQISDWVSDEVLQELCQASGLSGEEQTLYEDTVDWEMEAKLRVEAQSTPLKRRPGCGAFFAALFGALFRGFGGDAGNRRGRSSPYCDGDCEHCPPHFGYRYGRWYYGHGHQYGCMRGGNGGACGKGL